MKINLSELVEKETQRGTKYYVSNDGEISAKTCTHCGEVKYLSEFSKHKRMLGGRQSQCKICRSVKAREYYINNSETERERVKKWKEENREKVNQWARNYRKVKGESLRTYRRNWEHENKEREYLRKRKWFIENAEKEKERKREWRQNNREHYREYSRNHRKENKEMYQIHSQRRRARKEELPDTLTEKELFDILDTFKDSCALSGVSEYHLDHVIPLATGHGGTIYENMIPLRADLNISKKDRCIFDWFADNRERFGLEQRKFDELIEYLADINDMTVEEYEDYVRWCHDNPRSINEIETKKESKEPAS